MGNQHELIRERLRVFGGQLAARIYREQSPVALSAYATPGRIGYDEAMAGDYRSIDVGYTFGPHWSTHWVRVEAEIPAGWDAQEVRLLWDSTSEACVWADGEPLQGLTGSWNRYTREAIRPECCLSSSARGGERIQVYVEVAVNTLFGVEPNVLDRPELGLLRSAAIARFDRAAWDLYWDFAVLADLARALPPNTPRGGQALRAANAMVNAIDLDDKATWPAARAIAARFFQEHNGDGQHNVSAVGHAHLDTAWLWPVAETRRKAVRTFSTAVRYCEEYPDFRFAASQAQHYAWVKEAQPRLFERIREAVAWGQVVPVGGMWIEPDVLIPSGESLVRQFLFGQRFFRKEFGITCGETWLFDSFGFPAQLPQIMHLAGIRHFLTVKLMANWLDKMPASTFWWEGLDGTRVLAHLPPWDNYQLGTTPGEVLRNVAAFCDHERSRESALIFGYGDGGGGPTRGMIEGARRLCDVDGAPRVSMRSPSEFFARCEEEVAGASGLSSALDALTIWSGELYFERHRGCYTSQAKTKYNNRRAEWLLHDVEFLSAVAFASGRAAPYPSEELESLWQTVLLNQFHDILPGTSIGEVYVEAAEQYADVMRRGEALCEAAAAIVAGGGASASLVAINTLGVPRDEVVELPATAWTDNSAAQFSASGTPLARVTVPAYGVAPVASDPEPVAPVRIRIEAGAIVVENELVAATFGTDASLLSLVDKRSGRECIEPGQRANAWLLSEDISGDAWDFEAYHVEKQWAALSEAAYAIVEAGPLRAAVVFSARLGRTSHLRLTVSLTAHSPRLDLAAQVDWHEVGKLLRTQFPLALHSPRAAFETQYGYVDRPTHRNTSWDAAKFEVPAQRWAALSEMDFGVALLNDCKYGYSAHGSLLGLSLLRATHFPDPCADIGMHAFRYALYPFSGSLKEGGVVAEGLRFNHPPILARGRCAAPVSYFTVDAPHVVLDTVKKAEDSDALIVRLYEAYGARVTCRLSTTLPVASAAACNVLEEEDQPLDWKGDGLLLTLRPFQILTLKLNLARRGGLPTRPAP